jgi:hypothetical protein
MFCQFISQKEKNRKAVDYFQALVCGIRAVLMSVEKQRKVREPILNFLKTVSATINLSSGHDIERIGSPDLSNCQLVTGFN